MWKSKTTLAIETSCDDTSLWIIRYEDGVFHVDSLHAYSQIDAHQQYGGVVPEIAFRLHSEQILAILHKFPEDIRQSVDLISVTTHPWLAWSLLVGKTVAHMLGHQYSKPVVWVHHIYGHIFSLLLERKVSDLVFPWLILTASGGHNEIYLVDRHPDIAHNEMEGSHQTSTHSWDSSASPQNDGLYKLSDLTVTKLWKTLDDASWECFDKVSRMLGGPNPGGPWMSQQAALGSPHPDFRFKRILMKEHENPYDFSFSGMKAHAYTLLQRLEREWVTVQWQVLYDIAYEFQESVVDTLSFKLQQAADQYNAKTIGIVWWVSANDRLFEKANDMMGNRVLRPVKKVYSTDNAAMIGVVGLLS
jgi:N6-L-threonylcarbamoyladenine synthase